MINDAKNGHERNNDNEFDDDCHCECCHCKKIFMMLVVLILVFMAGIMVGNCGRCHYADGYYDNAYVKDNKGDNKSRVRKHHRGMQPISNQQGQVGGFIIEVD